ncbi:nucleoside-diphosphate-sugar epimerase [Dysgonomonas sp. PH5-45]|uniref:NAD-dependent epimerase/dehydratase family protein n=1 Tax=unclassified Dysgonomonas TaxID=2630389 RepID=UPI0024755958|nr:MULTISPECIES: NAD-dependent epimerase/dehydratase family protein [unclassified Dysgonomonas]MDH6355292.1 nucleoside-diphosphate-sugar epimerase [Dysgonomonas sp. PH5-45]MDH6388182.1 nucleoside-diphosphate-sugar epimerase [Dysgonomonas sp. PH5-37]
MILFTGVGSLFDAFQKKYECSAISARRTSTSKLKFAFKSASVVIHNAANLSPHDLESSVEDNFNLTKRIVDTLYEVNPTAKFINIGSMSYLKSDSQYLDINDMTLYAYSKYLSETYCLKHQMKQIVLVRFSTLFYENPEKDGLSKLINDAKIYNKVSLINGGKACRNFLPIDAAVEYLNKIACGNYTDIRDKILNIVSLNKHSFKDIADYLRKVSPSLKIENIELPEAEKNIVLSEFSPQSIKNLGVVDFKLEDYILNYFNQLDNI